MESRPDSASDQANTHLKTRTDPSPAGSRQRPRTLTEARERKAPSAVNPTPGSLDTYDTAFIDAVQRRWQNLLGQTKFDLPAGKVVLNFDLNEDGSITNMKVSESELGPLHSALCQASVLDPAPFNPLPPEVRQQMKYSHRSVTMTFCGHKDACNHRRWNAGRQASELVCEVRCQPQTPASMFGSTRAASPGPVAAHPWGLGGPSGYGPECLSGPLLRDWHDRNHKWWDQLDRPRGNSSSHQMLKIKSR